MGNDFSRVSMFYSAIKDINEILDETHGYKDSDGQLEATLNAIKDINKKEFGEEITKTIILNFKKAIEDLYTEELAKMNEEVGLGLSFSPCEIPKKESSKVTYSVSNIRNDKELPS